jgi:hypothetical protein
VKMTTLRELSDRYPGIMFDVIPGYERYMIDYDGSIFTGNRRRLGLIPLVGSRHAKSGRKLVVLRSHGDEYASSVAALVLRTFVGPRPVGMECCHWDGDCTNDYLYNLYWGTRLDNEADRRRHRSIMLPKNPVLFPKNPVLFPKNPVPENPVIY